MGASEAVVLLSVHGEYVGVEPVLHVHVDVQVRCVGAGVVAGQGGVVAGQGGVTGVWDKQLMFAVSHHFPFPLRVNSWLPPNRAEGCGCSCAVRSCPVHCTALHCSCPVHLHHCTAPSSAGFTFVDLLWRGG